MADHHPTPNMLTAHSAGTLPLSQALCVAVHAEHCEQCKTHLLRLDSVGANLLAGLKPRAGSDALKRKVLALIDQPAADTTTPHETATPRASTIPRALRQFIPDSYEQLNWHYVSPSIRSATLCTDINGARVEMLRIRAGGRVATHTHTGDEYTLILEGSFSDESGIYRAGDFVLRDRRHRHKPVASKDRECICLTVTDAPIHFTGFFSRLLNPLIRKRYLPV